MSINSKHRRDARKGASRPGSRQATAPIKAHAHLRDPAGGLWGGAGLRGTEWVLVLGGKVAAATDSPGMVIAMLRHVAALREAAGQGAELTYSTTLQQSATAEARAQGQDLEPFLAMLEEERVARAAGESTGSTGDSVEMH